MATAAFALVGSLNYTDDVAMASTGGIVCSSTGSCSLRVPAEGRVLSMASGGPVRGFAVEGGPLHVVCPPGSSPIDLDHISGDVSVHGCSVRTCSGVEGHLTVDWDGSVDCTDFIGTVTSIGASMARIEGTGILNSGGTGITTVTGGNWRIRGSGPVNFTGASDFQFDSGTAGLEPTDWGWLTRPSVTLSEFAVPVPTTAFEDQTINVIGGWPDGSTLRGCVASGSFGYVPLISGSEVDVSDHAFGPVVERIERSIVRGNIRSEGPSSLILLNEVEGEISVATQTTFVNAMSGSSSGTKDGLTISGPHCVLCPDCGWTEFYDGSSPVAETDLYIADPTGPISLDLAGHHAILGTSDPDRSHPKKGTASDLPESHEGVASDRARRGLSTTGNVTNFDYTGGIVTLTNIHTVLQQQHYTFTDCTFEFGTHYMIISPDSSVHLTDSNVIGTSSAAETDYYAFFYRSGTGAQPANVTLDGCNVTGFIGIGASFTTIRNTFTEFEDSIVNFNINGESQWCVCSLSLWTGPTFPYIFNRGSNHDETTIVNQCGAICVFNETKSVDCSGPGEISLDAGSTECPTTTTELTTSTTLTPLTVTTTAYVPPAASSDSSSDETAIIAIAGVAAGSICILALTVMGRECMGKRKNLSGAGEYD